MTTVTIGSDTHRKLKKLKSKKNFGSFDELLKEIAEKELEAPNIDEMFGSMKIEDKENIRDGNDRKWENE
ncbi:MAG: antitoxin VapB family protein [Candidatus Nanohaloarchaea archaeon]